MKNIFDFAHVKSVAVMVLLDRKSKKVEGKIIANFSDNPNGSVCTAQIFLWKEYKCLVPKKETYTAELLRDLEHDKLMIGRAGGYGYDKLSSAIADAIERGNKEYPKVDFAGVGESGTAKWFEENLNLEVLKVL